MALDRSPVHVCLPITAPLTDGAHSDRVITSQRTGAPASTSPSGQGRIGGCHNTTVAGPRLPHPPIGGVTALHGTSWGRRGVLCAGIRVSASSYGGVQVRTLPETRKQQPILEEILASLVSSRTHVPSWPTDLDTIGARQIEEQAARHEVDRQKVRNLLARRSDTHQIAAMLGLVDAH